jgi:diacylglycerol kinase family enzyme
VRFAPVTTSSIPVFVNRNGGTARARGDKLGDELEQAFAAAGLTIDLQLIDGGAIAGVVASAAKAGHRLIVVGGGDGTIGCAAGALVKTGGTGALAVLPLGTRNHLARDLGLSNDLAEVAMLIAAGATRAIDLGEVNGRVFVNNASIGFYPEMVRRREAEQQRRGLPKWLAYAPAAWTVLKRARHHRLRLRMKGSEQEMRTPLLFVGNNRYALAPGKLGRRDSLHDGMLSVYALERRTPPAMIGFALRTLVGRADFERDFAMIGDTTGFEARLHNRSVDVALDGEVVRLAGPLEFRSLPKALTVIAPPALE